MFSCLVFALECLVIGGLPVWWVCFRCGFCSLCCLYLGFDCVSLLGLMFLWVVLAGMGWLFMFILVKCLLVVVR